MMTATPLMYNYYQKNTTYTVISEIHKEFGDNKLQYDPPYLSHHHTSKPIMGYKFVWWICLLSNQTGFLLVCNQILRFCGIPFSAFHWRKERYTVGGLYTRKMFMWLPWESLWSHLQILNAGNSWKKLSVLLPKQSRALNIGLNSQNLYSIDLRDPGEEHQVRRKSNGWKQCKQYMQEQTFITSCKLSFTLLLSSLTCPWPDYLSLGIWGWYCTGPKIGLNALEWNVKGTRF